MSKSLGNVIDPVHVIEGISLNQLKANLLTGNITDPEEIKRYLMYSLATLTPLADQLQHSRWIIQKVFLSVALMLCASP
jgi:valyl-tRNA synthetase